ncbi:hypothetical protein [Streptomyces sp. DH12]|uniref:hypothetical protein n=1 Tax=Streptomyces sp. DH12 TaxID=2857010 RepID=UPI001E46A8D4|nr:hypothetical protein [Streptomyces sp. DH12]
MNLDFLPPLAASLRTLGAFATRHEVNDGTLAEIAAELDRARSLVASARGTARANRCTRHPGGPVDPDVDTGCLLCGQALRRRARELPADFAPGEVLRFLEEHGHEAATARYGPRAVTHALGIAGRHPSHRRPVVPAPNTEGEN